MTVLEDRLRSDLGELADALIEAQAATENAPAPTTIDIGGIDSSGVPLTAPPARRTKQAALPAVAAAVLVVVAMVGGALLVSRSTDPVPVLAQTGDPAQVAPPANHGTWRALPDAPMQPRAYAVTAWTGTEAVFWAGASLDRMFAHSDGAAFDPTTDTWRSLTVPGWGHPGLTNTYLGDDLYLVAKGSAVAYNPTAGVWNDLPHIDGMYHAAVAAAGGSLWGIGPTELDSEGQPDLAIARYDIDSSEWIAFTPRLGDFDTAPIVNGLVGLETSVLTLDDEIILWHDLAGGLAFDTTTETWRRIDFPTSDLGLARRAWATIAGGRLAVFAEFDASGEFPDPIVNLARLDGDGWTWFETEIRVGDSSTMTVASAGDWALLFARNQPPITVHVPSGSWHGHLEAPVAGLEEPNAVWTGDELIIWGGIGSPHKGNIEPAAGAVWTPPAS